LEALMATSTPIDVKRAVNIAIEYLREFQDMMPARDLRLEETEYANNGDWLITLSISDEMASLGGIAAALGANKRNYKQFRIDAVTGEVKAMKVRTLLPVS
jgi:hypothetical protein